MGPENESTDATGIATSEKSSNGAVNAVTCDEKTASALNITSAELEDAVEENEVMEVDDVTKTSAEVDQVDVSPSVNHTNVLLPPLLSPVCSTGHDAAADVGPPPINIAFSFDTSGSMNTCIAQVREQLQELLERLFSDIPNLKVALIAHGDYCGMAKYVTKRLDFTNNLPALTQFVKNAGPSGGGDFPECYELVLHEARTEFSWDEHKDTQRSLVMIGDAIPHEPTYKNNKMNLDWRDEVEKLRDDLGVHIYSVQCQNRGQAQPFWQALAKMTNGRYLQLKEFRTILDIMMAICYKEKGVEFFDEFEKEVRCREGAGMRPELTGVFAALRDDDGSHVITTTTPPSPTAPKLNTAPVMTSNVKVPPRKTKVAARKITARPKVVKPTAVKTGRITKKHSRDSIKWFGPRKAAQMANLSLKKLYNVPTTKDMRMDDDDDKVKYCVVDESESEEEEQSETESEPEVVTRSRKENLFPFLSRAREAKRVARTLLKRTYGIKTEEDIDASPPGKRSRSAAKTTKKAIVVDHQQNGAILREKMYQNDAPGNHLNWTNWQLCLSSSMFSGKRWQQRARGVGFRRRDLFRRATQIPAVYEYSVLPPDAKRHQVVYMCTSTKRPSRWEARLLKHPLVRKQVDRVLKNNCDLFVRRAPVKSRDDLEMERKRFHPYDYAWDPQKRRYGKRKLVRNGVVIAA